MTDNNLPEWAGTAATFLGGGLVAQIFQWWRDRRKARLESDIALQETIDNRIRLILEDDEKTISRLQRQMSGLESYISTLVSALHKAGIPVPDRPHAGG